MQKELANFENFQPSIGEENFKWITEEIRGKNKYIKMHNWFGKKREKYAY
jgi:hypothetical protein